MPKEKCGATYCGYLVGLVGLDMSPMRRSLGILKIHITDNFDEYMDALSDEHWYLCVEMAELIVNGMSNPLGW